MLVGLTLVVAVASTPAPTPSPRPPMTFGRDRASELYSLRARRRLRTLLRMKLLEMREADLERAKAVIERRMHVETLLEHP